MIRVANAPVSYGAFELTVGVLEDVPDAEQVLDAIASAGYKGTELGPLGYLGNVDELRQRLQARDLGLAGAFIELGRGGLEETLDVLAALGGKPVLADAGPRDGEADWVGIERAAERARERGLEPTFHHHMGTRVQTLDEIEQLLERTDVGLLLDTGHLTAAGGDVVQALRDWRARVDHVHVKDVRLDVLRRAADWGEAWRGGAFCELGTGDVDLEGFFAELAGYEGWLVVEQDWVPGPGDDPGPQIVAQARNRAWLAEHAGL
ncbi:MAG: TIM barrel protein [Gaiellaceae bacterium]